jgi:hypothetical protein
VAAWILLGLLLVAAAFVLPRMTPHPAAQRAADVILWSVIAYGAICRSRSCCSTSC